MGTLWILQARKEKGFSRNPEPWHVWIPRKSPKIKRICREKRTHRNCQDGFLFKLGILISPAVWFARNLRKNPPDPAPSNFIIIIIIILKLLINLYILLKNLFFQRKKMVYLNIQNNNNNSNLLHMCFLVRHIRTYE